MASRSIQDLNPAMRDQVIALVGSFSELEFEVLFYCTLRSNEEQARLYRNGRTLHEIRQKAEKLDKDYDRPDLAQILLDVGPQFGKQVVTWAGPGQSLHNYGYAVDGVPLIDGKPVWDTESMVNVDRWNLYGSKAEEHGLAWAGRWPKHKREFPHIQLPEIHWADLIRGV